MEAPEANLIRVLVLSRASQGLVYLIGDSTGLYKPYGGESDKRRFTVETAVALVSIVYISFVFSFEPLALPASFINSMIAGTNMTLNEKMLFDSMRAVKEMELKRRALGAQ